MSFNSDYCCGSAFLTTVENDNGKITDYRFSSVNSAWCRLMSMENPAGKTVLELFPNTERRWLNLFRRVLEKGVAEKLIDKHVDSGREWDLYCFASEPQRKEIGIIFSERFSQDVCLLGHSRKRQEDNAKLIEMILSHPDDYFIRCLREDFIMYF